MKTEHRNCRTCDRATLHTKKTTGYGCLPNAFLAVVTCGLWIPIALLTMGFASLGNAVESWTCNDCVNVPASKRDEPATADAPAFSLGRVFVLLAVVFGLFAWVMSN